MSESYLLDTVTVSELSKSRPSSQVSEWIIAHDTSLRISVLTFGEIIVGIERVARRDPALFDRLTIFVAALEQRFVDRILDFGMADAKQWGVLTARLGNREIDLQLAATALVHDLTVVTRNVRHFEPAGVRVVNPWEG